MSGLDKAWEEGKLKGKKWGFLCQTNGEKKEGPLERRGGIKKTTQGKPLSGGNLGHQKKNLVSTVFEGGRRSHRESRLL